MKLYKPLEVPLLYDNATTDTLTNTGIRADDELFDVKMGTFYEVSSIAPQDGDKDDISVITSDGSTYSVKMPYKELKKLVDEAMM
jgi:hypothetical protein